MNVLKNIFDKIFHSAHAEAAPTSHQAAPAPNQNPSSPAIVAPSSTSATSAKISEADVEEILTDFASKAGQPLNWRTSIADLMKLLNLDSSVQARKELAQELHYFGNTEDPASMNIWLHEQVMQKLTESGGKVPAD